MNKIKIAVILLVLLIISKIYTYIINKINTRLSLNYNESKIKYGLISRKDLSNMYGNSFTDWCMETLDNMNFRNLVLLNSFSKKETQLTALYSNEPVYIYCIQKDFQNVKEDDFETVDKSYVQILLASMFQKNIKKGYILTNGVFSKEAKNFIQNIPQDFSITLIDGAMLTRIYRNSKLGINFA